jgi:hypothetical protein
MMTRLDDNVVPLSWSDRKLVFDDMVSVVRFTASEDEARIKKVVVKIALG